MRIPVLILGHNDATQFIDIYNQYTQIFDKARYEITVAYLAGEPKEDTIARTLAEHVVFLQASQTQLRYLKISPAAKVLKLCREKKFQIVICHRYKPIYLMLWIARFVPIKALICVLHEFNTLRLVSRRLLIWALAGKNVYFAGVSNAVRNYIQKSLPWFPKERVITLYNVIDVDLTEDKFYSRRAARNHLGIHAEDFVFGQIARLTKNKDQTTLLVAFAKIAAKMPNAKLILIGDGDLELQTKNLVETLNLEKHVIFTGFLPQAFRYLPAFDCFILSSIQEAFGRVLIEAMLAKLPIIATQVNGIPEVMGQTGTVIPAKDVAALSDAMIKAYLQTPAQRKAYGREAYAHVLESFSLPAFKNQFWNIFA